MTKTKGFKDPSAKRETINRIYVYLNRDIKYTKMEITGGKTYDVKKVTVGKSELLEVILSADKISLLTDATMTFS